ncbi:MAG TPA: amino acid ABC transporter substrate-binding protein [Acetobacteraceae bacterium]|jgi:glutamate/aspartate transport system substrate-binding protein|nr:amino acid ABC transporter substrate-binding protein [Acetobacteraceae bacterium]
MKPDFWTFLPLAALAALAFTAAPAGAQTLDSVVTKLKATNTLTIGYRDTSVPLSYLGKDNKPTGYAVEFCQDIGRAAQRDLKLPEIKFAYVPVTIQTRQALIANGTVDIVCDGTVRTWTRMKQVAFTPIHWVSAEQLLVLKDSGIKDIKDLNGKVVIVATGGTSEPTIQRLLKDGLKARVLHVNDHPAALVALESHRGDAYLSDNAAFYALIQSSHHPDNLAVVGPELSYQPEALIIPKNNPQFAWIAGHEMSEMFKSGAADKLVEKWFSPFHVGVSPKLRAAWDTYSFPN